MAIIFLELLSKAIGWIYTLCWSLSFYPQPILNFSRRSASGTTIDYPAVNTIGFIAYFISTSAFLYSPLIRRQYALRYHGLAPTVQFNDLAFAAHAVVLSGLTLSQFIPRIWGFDKRGKRGSGARISKGILGIVSGSLVGVVAVILTVAFGDDDDPVTGWAWIDAVYAISYVKLVITLVKYMPQVLTNYRNKSTHGWAIGQILLDFSGGVLSISQLLIDSYLQYDWAGIRGNPVKWALGNISIFFDIIFFIQHYYLYKGNKGKPLLDEERPLMDDASGREQRIA